MKRFDIETCCGGPTYLAGNPDGKYVKYEEVEALQARCDQLLAALEKMMEGCEHKVIMGEEGWHEKHLPNDYALDLARAAIAAARGDK